VSRRALIAIALAAVVSLPAPTRAEPVSAAGGPALAGMSSGLAVAPLTLGVQFVPRHPATVSAVELRPRSTSPPPGPQGLRTPTPMYLHFGAFSPTDGKGDAYTMGMRLGVQVVPRLELGVLVDWMRRTNDTSAIVNVGTGPGGAPITTREVYAHATTDLLPTMVYAQVSAVHVGVVPYGGIAGGYQTVFVTAIDYTKSSEFHTTLGGLAWQAWGGLGIPLAKSVHLNGEVFFNEGEAVRTYYAYGLQYRESVDLSGVGARAGLSWGY
jgi:hypothetical protein